MLSCPGRNVFLRVEPTSFFSSLEAQRAPGLQVQARLTYVHLPRGPLLSKHSKQERKREMKGRAGICHTKIKHKYSSNTIDRDKRQIGEIFAKMIN